VPALLPSLDVGGADIEELALGAEVSPWRIFLSSLVTNVPALLSAAFILFLILVAALAPVVAPFNPNEGFMNGLTLQGAPLPPDHTFLLGTDANGRDVLSRLIYGARISLTIGIVANGFAMVIGVLVGMVSAYFGGWVDTVLMRITDVVMAFPILLLAIALIAITGPSVWNIIVVIALLYWTYVARVVHGMVLSLREREFVTATRTLGVSDARMLFGHILPHLGSAIIVYGSLGVATTILIESSLSYIGIGVPVPTATWGNMIAAGQASYQEAPWLMIFPGIALMLTVLSFNLVGDWLRDALDPMQGGGR
jgi:peptide/nickel transport system permease protein